MTNITGGLVSIEDGKKAAEEYAPARKVRIELKFDIAENEDAEKHLDDVIALAQKKLSELLGTTAAPKRPAATPKPAPIPEASAPAGGRTKADLEAEMLKAATAPKKPPAASKPANDNNEALGQELEKPAEDSLDDVLGGTPEPAKEITDADLTSAITKKNGEIKAPAKIRALIAQNTPEGKAPAAALIPQEKRATFLEKLSALTA